MALASSSPPEFIDIFVDRFDLRKYFSFLISGEDIKHSKPDPEIFLMCAEKLNVAPEECIVIEDAISGIEAAKRAGMGCIAIAGSHPRDELNKADFIASDLAEAKKYLTKLLQ